jgi:glyoxylase-like metal-dependent hydrolase (beta-lactamase superfamily II)
VLLLLKLHANIQLFNPKGGAMTDQTVFQLTENILVRQSVLYQTNSSAIIMDGKAIVVDPGVFQFDLEAFNVLLQPSQIAAGLITHAHWDHILWAPSLGNAPRYCSIGTDYQMMVEEPALRTALDQVEAGNAAQSGRWERSRFFDRTALTPGVYDLHGFHFELVELPGHCSGQAGFIFPQQGVAFVGDVLSDIEVPTISNRATSTEYQASLDKLELLIPALTWVVPGHGTPATSAEALARLALDRSYLLKLALHPGIRNLATDASVARVFLEELGEHRALSNDARGMHIENLLNIYGN